MEEPPDLIDASTETWIRTLKAMDLDFGPSTWVPGHGGVATRQGVLAFRAYLFGLRAGVRKAFEEGTSGDALVRAMLPALRSSYGRWGFFADFAAANILQTGHVEKQKASDLQIAKVGYAGLHQG